MRKKRSLEHCASQGFGRLELGEEVDETGEVERPLEEAGPQGLLTSSKERFYQRKDKKGLVQPYQDRPGAT